jgi:hypothetical protein
MKTIESNPELGPLMSKIPEDVMSKLKTALSGLESALLEADPKMKDHLRESHRLLISYPETVHLLDDSEISDLLKSAQRHMQVQIISEAAKKTSAKKTKPSVDDL